MNLKPYELKLIAKLLEIAADQFANHGCNDFDLVREAGLTPEEAYQVNRDCTLASNEHWEDDELHVTHAVYGDSGLMSFMGLRVASQVTDED